jgi:hypothetical protein
MCFWSLHTSRTVAISCSVCHFARSCPPAVFPSYSWKAKIQRTSFVGGSFDVDPCVREQEVWDKRLQEYLKKLEAKGKPVIWCAYLHVGA